MKAVYDRCSDLNIDIYKSDVSPMINGESLSIKTNDNNRYKTKFLINVCLTDNLKRVMEVKQNNIEQLKFLFNKSKPFDNEDYFLEGYDNNPQILKIIGWDIILNKKRFINLVDLTSKNPLTQECPFWARGLQYKCNFDRLHLTYWDEN
jgi:hypothetical protein